jgi:hypothetical protein
VDGSYFGVGWISQSLSVQPDGLQSRIIVRDDPKRRVFFVPSWLPGWLIVDDPSWSHFAQLRRGEAEIWVVLIPVAGRDVILLMQRFLNGHVCA